MPKIQDNTSIFRQQMLARPIWDNAGSKVSLETSSRNAYTFLSFLQSGQNMDDVPLPGPYLN